MGAYPQTRVFNPSPLFSGPVPIDIHTPSESPYVCFDVSGVSGSILAATLKYSVEMTFVSALWSPGHNLTVICPAGWTTPAGFNTDWVLPGSDAATGAWVVLYDEPKKLITLISYAAGGSGPTLGLITEYTFRPGGTAIPLLGIYDDWLDLMQAVGTQAAAGTPFSITVDLRSNGFPGATLLPAGSWDLGGECTLRGVPDAVSFQNQGLQADGAVTTLTGVRELTEWLTLESVGTVPWLLTGAVSQQELYMSREARLLGTAGPVLGVLDGTLLNLVMSQAAATVNGGAPCINVGHGSVLNVICVGTVEDVDRYIDVNTVTSTDATAALKLQASPGAVVEKSQPGFTGTMTFGAFMQAYDGGVWRQVREVNHATGPITLDEWDAVVNVDTSTGTISPITLPNDPPPLGRDRLVTVVDVGGMANVNPITVTAPGGGSIIGNPSARFEWPYVGITLRTKNGLDYTGYVPWGTFPYAFKFAGGGNQGTTLYQTDSSGASIATVPVSYPVVRACRMAVLEVWCRANTLNTNPGVSVTVFKNGAPTALSVSFGAGVTGSAQSVNDVDFVAGDRIDLVTVATGGTGAFSFGALVYGSMVETDV